MSPISDSYYHLHLISDATGETLLAVGRAAAAQYTNVSAIEHYYPLVRTHKQLDRVINEIELSPGIVLYTMLDKELSERLEMKCREYSAPCLSVLTPVHSLFQSFLGPTTTARIGAQHVLNAEYYQRIDALNYTMLHDDGQNIDNLEQADVILVGVSRTSKTPTSIYLANRGIKTANYPLVPHVPLPEIFSKLKNPLVVGLYASPERIVAIRQNRVLSLNAVNNTDSYIDRDAVSQELTNSRRLFNSRGWPVIDVSRRSIEETSATIISHFQDHKRKRDSERSQ